MTARRTQKHVIDLEYNESDAADTGQVQIWPRHPEHTDHLKISLYPDDDSVGVGNAVKAIGRPQIQIEGTPVSLEAFGEYLIALARTPTTDDLHDHFEDVQYGLGGTAHLIVRRI